MKITGLRVTFLTPNGEKEVTFTEQLPVLELEPGEMATLALPIVMDDEENFIVPVRRVN